jgi:hypothetical protein
LSASIPDLGQLTVGIFAFSCVLEKEKWQNKKCYISKNAEKSGHSESGLYFPIPADCQAQFATYYSINSFSLNSVLPWLRKNKWCIIVPFRSIIKWY